MPWQTLVWSVVWPILIIIKRGQQTHFRSYVLQLEMPSILFWQWPVLYILMALQDSSTTQSSTDAAHFMMVTFVLSWQIFPTCECKGILTLTSLSAYQVHMHRYTVHSVTQQFNGDSLGSCRHSSCALAHTCSPTPGGKWGPHCFRFPAGGPRCTASCRIPGTTGAAPPWSSLWQIGTFVITGHF